MYVVYQDNRPVSMASFLRVQVTINGKKEYARYVYAVATLPEYRKRGYASEIIKYAAEKYGEPLILQPADRDAQEYYEKRGFVEAFGESPCWIYAGRCVEKPNLHILPVQERTLKAAGETDTAEMPEMLGRWMVSDADEKEYKVVRDQAFAGEGYVDETKAANPQKAILMYRMEQDSLHIMETTLDDDELHNIILPELLEHTGAAWAYERNMGGMVLLPGRLQDWDCRAGYLGLTLG